jgi:serine/threonine protein phosphatase PrpC
MYVDSQGLTHVGRRSNNEDSLRINRDLGLYIVADGMGGYEGGEVASQLVVETIERFFEEYQRDEELTWPFALDEGLTMTGNLARVAVRLAHQRVLARRHGALAQMGSTVAMVALRGREALIAHVGDSRVYRLRGGALERMTRDHSLLEELRERPDHPFGEEAEARFSHVITRAVGIPPHSHAQRPDPDLRAEALEPGDIYLLCTDGLLEALDEARIAALLGLQPPAQACEALVREAYARGGRDNITAIVLEVMEP